MTTFIFMLTPDADDDQVDRIRTALTTQFPGHEFLTRMDEFNDIENNIMVVSDPAHVDGYVGAIKLPDEKEVDRVKRAFFALIR